VHSDEIDVQRALAYDKNSKERKSMWKDVMNKGDFAHNCKVFYGEKGEIIPYKRPSKATDATNYAECSTS